MPDSDVAVSALPSSPPVWLDLSTGVAPWEGRHTSPHVFWAKPQPGHTWLGDSSPFPAHVGDWHFALPFSITDDQVDCAYFSLEFAVDDYMHSV